MVLPPPMQSSLPAGWLAFTGKESNPLDHNKRFQITHPPFLDLSWRYRDELPAPHSRSLTSVFRSLSGDRRHRNWLTYRTDDNPLAVKAEFYSSMSSSASASTSGGIVRSSVLAVLRF